MSIQQSAFLSNEELQRYQRQIVLPEIGIEGQERLKQAKVLCVGAGGLGSPALLYLAAAGIGTLGIIDMDHVDVTNLQRQILYAEQDANMKKVFSASRRLCQLNKHITIRTYDEALTAANAEEIMRHYDLVIDGTDNFSTKYLINDCAVKCNIPYVYGAILGFEGRVMVLWRKTGPCYRCLYPQPPTGYIPNCAEFGIVGALAGIVGCVQAMEAIKWVVGNFSNALSANTQSKLVPLLGTLWMLDGRTMKSQSFKIKKNDNCITCGQNQEKIILQDLNTFCGSMSSAPIQTISVSESKAYLNQPHVILLDVRELSEWETGHIPLAKHFPLSQLTSGSNDEMELSSEKTYLLYCQTGRRSQIAATYLVKLGIKNVMHLSGGISVWDGEVVRD
jgi:sulfur-carrier protein adenylyltransferase/sulfurtransferase